MSPNAHQLLSALAADPHGALTTKELNVTCDLIGSATKAAKVLGHLRDVKGYVSSASIPGQLRALLWSITDVGRAALATEGQPGLAVARAPRTQKAAAAPKKRSAQALSEPGIDPGHTEPDAEEGDEEEEEEGEEEQEAALDCAVWMSGEVSICKGDINLLLGEAEAFALTEYLTERLNMNVMAERVAQIAIDRITSKLFDHPDDRKLFAQTDGAQARRDLKDYTESVFGRHFGSTEPTGLPGVELDGPNGIGGIAGIHCTDHSAIGGLTRAEQFAETAARG
jgi:hypothetical protein